MVHAQTHQVSSQGLQSFIEASPDYELAPIGLGSMREQAEKLAEYGRYGDIYIVHAAEGETVIPMEVLEANPQIKSLLFQQMEEMGLDPERYVVGNNLNSLNPVTGMPEFFFKKLWKSVKSVIPYIAPIIGNMIAPGIGGLIATGLATKLSGGSWGDALKATALAYGTQAVYSGLSSMGSEEGSFMKGFGEGLTAPYKATRGAITGGSGKYADPFEQGIFGSGDEIFPIYDPTYGADPSTTVGGTDTTRAPGEAIYADGDTFAEHLSGVREEVGVDLSDKQKYDQFVRYTKKREAAQLAATKDDKGPLLGEYSPSEYLLGEGKGSDIIDIGAATLLADQFGLFDPSEEKQPVPGDFPTNISNQPTAEELLAEDRLLPLGERRFTIGGDLLDPSANIPSLDVQVPTTFPYPMYGAHGGTVNYPRQTGQINGPGTATSDSIPAMLSDGEFVMTKRAVDGAGGPGTMYDLMRNFEMRT
jgi:hypothetical protein